jgi:hypothetical protein
MKGQRTRETPFFVEDEEALLLWENDSYLVDRKNLFKQILKSDDLIDILELYSKSSTTITNFGRLLNEIVEKYGGQIVDERTILISKNVKLNIFINRKEIFTPPLSKVWKLIPKDFQNN